MKILNLYAGIGGNRQHWGQEHEITAVEINPKIADDYKLTYPSDNVIIADAHEYLLANHKNFDFIWSSPPCQTHSRTNHFINNGIANTPRYPDMSLYQEIIFMKHFAKCLWCIENVISYYQPLIPCQTIGRHQIWSNFKITKINMPDNTIGSMKKGYNKAYKQKLEQRNMTDPNLGLHILNCAQGIYASHQTTMGKLF